MFKQRVAAILIAVFITGFITSSCESEPDVLTLPPKASLDISLSQFPSGAEDTSNTKSIPSIRNWLFSSLTVLSWNAVLATNIAIPVAAYAEAFNHTPVYLGDNQWEWNYSATIKGKTYNARLLGARIDNEIYSMEMFLSQGQAFSDFKWFEGIIRYDHTDVNWTISHSPSSPINYLDIAYEKDFETDKSKIVYTVIDPENALFESYIEFGKDTSQVFDAFYNINRNDTLTNIQWDLQTNAGRVMNKQYFGDHSWHCWDSQLMDVKCPDDDDDNNQLQESAH
ncbi:MAG TPA: hypothetical protein VJ951_10850 [Bacteroidales bacterium]|nr:hypothetical protein [Bacteroidales bacterium]